MKKWFWSNITPESGLCEIRGQNIVVHWAGQCATTSKAQLKMLHVLGVRALFLMSCKQKRGWPWCLRCQKILSLSGKTGCTSKEYRHLYLGPVAMTRSSSQNESRWSYFGSAFREGNDNSQISQSLKIMSLDYIVHKKWITYDVTSFFGSNLSQ